MKRVLLLRWGTYGDGIIMSMLPRLYKEKGWEVTVHAIDKIHDVLKHNPYIDKRIVYVTDTIPNAEMQKYWDELAKGYDKFINLSESIEGSLLKVPTRPDEYNMPYQKRHELCNINYYDNTLRIAGFRRKGINPELYFSHLEESLAKDLIARDIGTFKILWCLSGSSEHKAYPYSEFVAVALMNKYKDIMIYTVGDEACELLEWQHNQTRNYAGKWSVRRTMLMTKYVNLVISPETFVLNASGAFDTPKIALLSHSSEENLTKHFKNCKSVTGVAECHPCHQMHFSGSLGCPTDEMTMASKCMSTLSPDYLFKTIEEEYKKWKGIDDGENIRTTQDVSRQLPGQGGLNILHG